VTWSEGKRGKQPIGIMNRFGRLPQAPAENLARQPEWGSPMLKNDQRQLGRASPVSTIQAGAQARNRFNPEFPYHPCNARPRRAMETGLDPPIARGWNKNFWRKVALEA
jgi:hypothetical protein